MNARTLTKSLGGMWCGSYGLAKCPTHHDRKPSLKIKDDNRKADGIDLHCFSGCGWQDVKAEFRRLGLLGDESEPRRCVRTARAIAPGTILSPKIDAADDDLEGRIKSALRIWNQSVPLPNTLGWRYFCERRQLHIGLLGDLSHALRWHKGIGAVVALMTDPITNEPTGIHRTFLNSDSTKRERKMLAKAGVVRVSPDEAVTHGLGLTEGIEDALAVLISGWSPVWAATSAGAIERFPVFNGIGCLTVHADYDNPGIDAAQVCVDRWIAAGREAFISYPKDLRDE